MVEQDALVAKGIIVASGAVFCSRYHGCVSALSAGIACIGTSWSHKYESLYAEYEANELLLNPAITPAECESIIELSVKKNSAVASRIAAQSIFQMERSNCMWDEFRQVVCQHGSFASMLSE